ncbi:hypothetical protein [Leifsonia sp. Leaf264]|uniref:hypothetical protein n=1 Tax=Leifsonia sp. Leaf264 TaxID=1736314 RepID=UPI0006FF8EDD|nr:hypothetical protein [Leifsonia sp. Leaf264]KQO98407.1 hypothetical protein ASF30_10120 [Leifsonia sp. Leaf264]
MFTNTIPKNHLIVEDDRVVICDKLAVEVINEMLEYSEIPEAAAGFLELFDVVKPTGYFLADPNADFYQGLDVMAVIRRKSDGRLFGFKYWTSIAKYPDTSIDPNGEDHGFEFDFDSAANHDWEKDHIASVYVFLPVEPFTITGYKH